MLTHLVAALLQLPAPSVAPQAATPPPARAAADTAERDSTTGPHRRRGEKRPPKRVEVTAEHLATAFKDSSAREILMLARDARMRQDSALLSYDATTYQRISAGLGFASIGRDRLAFRSEDATHVRWRRGVGAYVDVTGQRTVIPIAGSSMQVPVHGNISPIPYYPGNETLWIGSSVARAQVDENQGLVHPLAEGAEAYFTYQSGDSVTFRLPDGKSIRLRELKVRPREPKWNLAVGSLWFDMSGGQLVRAAYRMSEPMDIVAVAKADNPKEFDDVPAVMKPMLFPMTAQISAIGVEYGLYQGRFWLPRVQVAEGGARMGFMRVPFKLEQKYQYENVNAGAPLPPIVVAAADSERNRNAGLPATIGGDDDSRKRRDSVRAARRAARMKCDSTGNRTYARQRDGMPDPVFVTISCDTAKLAHSPDLPPSIYDKGEDVLGGEEMQALVSEALSMGAQADFKPQRPTLEAWRPRYNRIEGLSLGAQIDQTLGAGYSVHAVGRIGVADREPNVELTGSRSDLRRRLSVSAYNRLTSESDWGNPLSLGSSISAFLFGRDEGFYYRATGVELSSAPDQSDESAWSYGVFAEQERSAQQRTTFSLARAAYGTQFDPNFVAVRGIYVGARTRYTRTFGLDPQGFRLFSDARLEGAHGDTGSYGRAALDLTASHGIGNGAAALTLAGGSSVGVLPAQRYWYLGGTQTVRGQRPGLGNAVGGNAFWLARSELAYGLNVVRPVVFADLGWAGDRTKWRDIGRPLSGVGAGTSIMDGLIRFDVARGIYPEKQWRVDAYVEGRF
jgi:Omp85 superfamily domain